MPKKIATIEEFNRDNILLKNELNNIHQVSISLAYLLKIKGDTNMAIKVEKIAVMALRALEATNGQTTSHQHIKRKSG